MNLPGFQSIAKKSNLLSLIHSELSFLPMIFILVISGAIANAVCLTKRMILPTGISPHYLFGEEGFMMRFVLYIFFGALSGFAAAIAIKAFSRFSQDQ